MKPVIDMLVVTASSAAQARGYRAQLAERARSGALAAVARWRVIPDCGGRRIGSGAATINALYELARGRAAARPEARTLASLFADQRILIIHSGGDSRRLPAYAAQGKLFTPLPRVDATGRGLDLFDLVLEDLTAVMPPGPGRVVIAAGDLYLGLADASIDLACPGVVGVAAPGPVSRAMRHGVYIADRAGRVRDFLQKPSAATARARGALDRAGRALIDTGVIGLDAPAAARLLRAAGVKLERARPSPMVGAVDALLRDIRRGRAGTIDLYEHVLMALPRGRTRRDYLRAVGPGALEEVGRSLHAGLNGMPFSVVIAARCEFLHIGTSRELLRLITGNRLLRGSPPAPITRFNSIGPSPARARGPVVIEACEVPPGLDLRGSNIITGVPAAGPDLDEFGPLRLPPRTGLVCLPIGPRDWAALVYGIDDDAKTSIGEGGTFLNEPLTGLVRRAGLPEDELWSSATRTLWTARLWRVGPAVRVMNESRSLIAARTSDAWRHGRRVSMEELFPRVNHERLIAHRAELQRRARLADVARRLLADPWMPAARAAADVKRPEEARAVVGALVRAGEEAFRDGRPLTQARLLRAAAVIRGGAQLDRAAFGAVARAVERTLPIPGRARAAAIRADQVVWVTTPVRIDFAGGWSDTPPICHELGGAVVNAAITLNGQYPVQVMARLSERPGIRLSSVDLGRSVHLATSARLSGVLNPHDWAALPKAALVLAGLAPASAGESFGERLKPLGGGLELTMFSALPKGSGLGTSSALGAAILAALDRLHGEEIDHRSLIRRTSLLEQMMSTAGGWQDQAGGITPGVKLLTTAPGPDQVPTITPLPFPVDEAGRPAGPFAGRMLLYYTGQRRLARDILQHVVARYLARDPGAVEVLRGLKAGAEFMARAISSGSDFGPGLEDYWRCKKALDPGSTNARLESILAAVRAELSAAVLPGAGGGGFILMLARSARAAGRVRERLTRRPPNPLARFYDFAIDPYGLRVSVL